MSNFPHFGRMCTLLRLKQKTLILSTLVLIYYFPCKAYSRLYESSVDLNFSIALKFPINAETQISKAFQSVQSG